MAGDVGALLPESALPDPNKDQEWANRWMEVHLGVDGSLLRRLHERFEYCRRTSHSVRRGDLSRSLENCSSLLAAIAITPVCLPGAGQVVVPRIWGDVAMDLTMHESDLLSWADVLEVVRTNRDISLGLLPAPSPGKRTQQRPGFGPVMKVSEAKERLEGMMGLPRPKPAAASSREASPARRPRVQEAPGSPAAAAAAIFARLDGGYPAGGPHVGARGHPLMDYDSDESPAPPERLAAAAVDSAPAVQGPGRWQAPSPEKHAAAPRPGQRQVKVRLEVSRADYEKWRLAGLSGDHVEGAVAKVLGLPGNTVRMKGRGP
mmetsp:Transcript_33111/g.103674  ORF Transcript_33111/g.103674 Transcript_33111/m.103674 type:complete len:318 (-) Transcript_33111:54-1007(-)